jgi:hypothetical protein
VKAPSRQPTGKNHAVAAAPRTKVNPTLERKAFVTSRLADFASKAMSGIDRTGQLPSAARMLELTLALGSEQTSFRALSLAQLNNYLDQIALLIDAGNEARVHELDTAAAAESAVQRAAKGSENG